MRHGPRWCSLATLAVLVGLAAPAGAGVGDAARRTFRFQYAVKVRDIPPGAQRISVWVPVPMTDTHQTVRDLKIESPVPYRMEREAVFGNSMLHLEAQKPLPREIDLQLTAIIERRAYRVLDENQRQAAEPERKPLPRDLEPERLVPIDGKIAAIAAQVTRRARTPLAKARAIYDYVTSELKYDKSGDGWGRGDAVYACDVRRGNCTDFHSLILGMARSQGIPGRFVIGFPLPEDRTEGSISGYHCWAELYIDGLGWLPVDSSEASRHPEKRETFFGGLDANRVELTRGRDLDLVPEASEALNFFVYPHVEVDGKPHAGIDRAFSFADVGG